MNMGTINCCDFEANKGCKTSFYCERPIWHVMKVKAALTEICFGLQAAEPPTFLNLKVPEPSVMSESVQSLSPSPSTSAPCRTAEPLWSDISTALFHCGNSAISELQDSPSDPAQACTFLFWCSSAQICGSKLHQWSQPLCSVLESFWSQPHWVWKSLPVIRSKRIHHSPLPPRSMLNTPDYTPCNLTLEWTTLILKRLWFFFQASFHLLSI